MFGLSFGLKGMAIAAAVSLALGSFSGWKARDVLCDAADARQEVERMKKERDIALDDLAKARQGEKDAKAQADSIEDAKRKREGEISALKEDLAKRPQGDRCTLSDADARRLRSLARSRAGRH